MLKKCKTVKLCPHCGEVNGTTKKVTSPLPPPCAFAQGSPLPHLHRDCADCCPHLRRDCAQDGVLRIVHEKYKAKNFDREGTVPPRTRSVLEGPAEYRRLHACPEPRAAAATGV